MNGTRLGLYDWMDKRGFTRDKEGKINPFFSAVVATTSGAIGGAVESPFFLVIYEF